MEVFAVIALIIFLLMVWKHILVGLIFASIFGLIGMIFGETGAGIGAFFGLLWGIHAVEEEKKEKDAESSFGDEPKTQSSHTTSSNGTASSSDNNIQIIRCPGCARKIRVGLPLKRPSARCPACSARFDLWVDSSGKLRVGVRQDQWQWREEEREEPRARGGASMADYYAILGVAPSASPDEVRAAYRKKIREYHPDRVVGLGEKLREMANEESQTINNAYSMLKAAGLAS